MIMRMYANGTHVGQIQSASDQLQLNAITSIPMIFKTNNTERMRIDASGNIGLQNGAYIGTTSSSHAITVQGGAGNPGGSIRFAGATETMI